MRGQLNVIEDVSLEIRTGEMVTLIGANGSGKSTLIEAVLGQVPIHSGKVELGGVVGWVPEGRRVFSDFTVLENLRMGGYRLQNRRQYQESLDWVHELFPVLKERENQMAGLLSGGEQQMVAIARAIMSNPQILILDELSLGLAPKVVLEVFASLKQIANRGVGLWIVEQNAELALHYCSRGYVLNQGRIVAAGKSDELLRDQKIRDAYFG